MTRAVSPDLVWASQRRLAPTRRWPGQIGGSEGRARAILDWPGASVVCGDAVDVVAGLTADSAVPLRSHGSLSMNRALMAAGLVDRVQVTIFPVITGRTGTDRVFAGAADFDLELLAHRALDRDIHELVYRPTVHPGLR